MPTLEEYNARKGTNADYYDPNSGMTRAQYEVTLGSPATPTTAPITTAPVTPTPTVPTGLVGLRDTATAQGLNVGNQGATPIINGTAINTAGLQDVGGHWYGSQEQINSLLSPYSYQNPYAAQEQAALADYQKWASQPYVAQYAPEIEGLVKNILSRQFNYDPANDAQLQLATKEVTRNVLETMNQRGVLNSTLSRDGVMQGVADLLPQYQQLARSAFNDEGEQLMSKVDMLMGIDETQYGRYQDEGTKLANVLDTVMQMDDNQYQKWSDAYTRRYQTQRDQVNDAANKVEADRQAVKDAWDRTSELGYVDNQSSIVIGVPAGTLSKEAREAKIQREQEIADQRTSLNQQLAVINAQYAKEQKVATLKADSTAEAETLGNEKQVSNYYELRDIYFGGGSGTYANDPLKAYNWLMAHAKDNIALVGQNLYNKLLTELTDNMKTQKSYGTDTTIKSTDYKTDPDFAANVEYVNANPDNALTEIKNNAAQLIQDYGVDGYNYLYKLAGGE